MAHADDRADALSLQASDEDLSLEEGPRAQKGEGGRPRGKEGARPRGKEGSRALEMKGNRSPDRRHKKKRTTRRAHPPTSSSSSSSDSSSSSSSTSSSASRRARPPTRRAPKVRRLQSPSPMTSGSRSSSGSSTSQTSCTSGRSSDHVPRRRSRSPRHHKRRYRRSDRHEVRGRDKPGHSLQSLERNICTQGHPPPPTQNGSRSHDVIDAAGRALTVDNDLGEPISDNLAQFITQVFVNKPNEEIIKDKAGQYKKPANCLALRWPITNEEIWKSLNSATKKTDTKMTNIQIMVTKAAAAVAECLDKQATTAPPAHTQLLLDALIMLGRAHQSLTLQRREQQKPALPREYKSLCDISQAHPNNTLSKFLYGDDIRKKMKEAKEERSLLYSLSQSSHPAPKARRFGSKYRPSGGQSHSRPFLGGRKGFSANYRPYNYNKKSRGGSGYYGKSQNGQGRGGGQSGSRPRL